MLRLVQRVYRDPSQRSFTGFRVVVDDHPLPVAGAQSGKDIAEQLCRVSELAGHILRLLLGIPIVNNSLIASRWGTVRPIHPAGREHSFALHEQHVPQMAAILKGRPHARLPPGSQVNLSVAQDCPNLSDPLPDILLDRPRLTEVVNETASPDIDPSPSHCCTAGIDGFVCPRDSASGEGGSMLGAGANGDQARRYP